MSRYGFCSYGGGVHHSAIIGQPPEHEDWKPSHPVYLPQVSPLARVEAFVTVDSGIWKPTRIGPRAWLLKHAHVGHDVQVGADCVIAVGAIIGGHCILQAGVKVGLGAVILPFTKIGEGARIGAGAVVTHHVPAGETWAGNPARKMEHDPDYAMAYRCCGGLGRHAKDCEFVP